MIKITVITVCLNSEKTLEKTIKSVLEQDYTNLEFIIIDGKSTDGTTDIIQRYESKISYWCSEKDGGVYDAMNKGLNHSTGDVIAFLNSDDWYEPGALKYVGEYFEKNKLDVLVGLERDWIDDRELKDVMLNSAERKIEDLKYGSMPCHQAIFMSRCMFNKVGGFDVKYRISADYDLMIRAYKAGGVFQKVDRILVNFSCDGISQLQAYYGGVEMQEIALKNARDDKDLQCEIRKKINLTEYYKCALIRWICKYEPDYIKDKFNRNDRKLYIWGTGTIGKEVYGILQTVGVNISGFIDSNKKQDKFYGCEILLPELVPHDAAVCIAVGTAECPKVYYEIREQAKKMGFSEEQCVWFEDVKSDLVKYGKDKYDFRIWK
jgi:glycosyltransferase involved in cell wall biosynthesis